MILPGTPFVDDRARIQLLLDNGERQFGPGDFYVGGPIVIPFGAQVYGEGIGLNGMGKTTILALPTAEGETRSAVVTLSNGSGLKWIGTESLQAACNGITMEYVQGCVVESCRSIVRPAHSYAIWCRESSDCKIIACEAKGDGSGPNEQEGIEVYTSKNILVQDCITTGIGRCGFNLYCERGLSSDSVTFLSCVAQGNSINYAVHITDEVDNEWTGKPMAITRAVFKDCLSSMPKQKDFNIVSGPCGRIGVKLINTSFSKMHINTRGLATSIEVL